VPSFFGRALLISSLFQTQPPLRGASNGLNLQSLMGGAQKRVSTAGCDEVPQLGTKIAIRAVLCHLTVGISIWNRGCRWPCKFTIFALLTEASSSSNSSCKLSLALCDFFGGQLGLLLFLFLFELLLFLFVGLVFIFLAAFFSHRISPLLVY
jgi:hypothetical protein